MADERLAMDRRRFMGAMAGVGAAAFAAPAVLTRSTYTGKPNIIIMLSDDQGYQDLSSYGHPSISTPHIDSIGEQGIRFTDFYSGFCVCSPARACLLTGSYAPRVGLYRALGGGQTANQGLNTDEVSLAKLLKGQGYATFGVQKWHLGSKTHFGPSAHGFDTWASAAESDRSKNAIDATISWIDSHKSAPFFAYVAFTCPHERLIKGSYAADVEDMDTHVGRLLDYLDMNDLTSNTLVIFYSDNGPWADACEQLSVTDCTWHYEGGSALPLRGEKFDAFEGGMRVPCVARFPGGIPAGITCSEIATGMDFYPTIANMVGAPIPCALTMEGEEKEWVIDGKDIMPLLTGQSGAVTPHETVFYYDIWAQMRAVRAGKWKWHFQDRLLYDLEADIGETTNLYADESAQAVRDAIVPLVTEHRNSIRSLSRPVGDSSNPPPRYTANFDCVSNTTARYRPARRLTAPGSAGITDLMGRMRPPVRSSPGIVVDPNTGRARVRLGR